MKKVNIHFLSSFKQMDNDDNVDFKSTGTIVQNDNETILKFKEALNDVETTIIYNDTKAKIHTGNSEFNFEIDKVIKNIMKTAHGEIIIFTNLKKLISDDTKVYLEYQLTNEVKESIGYFKITVSFA